MRKLFKAGRLNISPSQIDTYLDCPRKWWMSYVLGLPEPARAATTLGDVGHSVVGRYLEGFDGEDLYPKGWEQARNRWTNEPEGDPLSLGEQQLLKALIHNAIHSGMLSREPDGVVEEEIRIDLDEVPVRIKMFLDYRTQHAVIDHKFCKNTRYYGPEKLSKATAMNLYGLAGMRQGLFAGDDVWLRYNLFVKDPVKLAMKQVEVETNRDQLEDYYERTVLPACKGMLHMWERAQKGEVTEAGWAQVQGPDTPATCDNYGGCQFQQICSGARSIQQYRESFEKKDVSTGSKFADLFGKDKKQKEDRMPGFRDKLKRMREEQSTSGGTINPPAQAVPREPDEVGISGGGGTIQMGDNDLGVASHGRVSAQPEPKPAVAAGSDFVETVRGLGLVAPWYYDGCKQCSSNAIPGFNKELSKPCAVCAVFRKKAGLSKPDDYTIDISGSGAILVVDSDGEVLIDTGDMPVEEKAEVVKSIQPELTGTETVQEIVVQETPNAPVPEPEPVEQTVPVADPVVEEKPKRQRKSRSRAHAKVQEQVEARAAETAVSAEGDDGKGGTQELYPFTLSYVPVRDREGQDPNAEVGDEGVILPIGQLLEYIQDAILKAANDSGAKAGTYHDVNPFTRRDLIAKNAHVIAASIGHSTLEATCVQAATDQAHICSAIEHLACRVYGSL
jgi:hypothetical protein